MADGGGSTAVIPYYSRPQFSGFHARTQRWAIIVAHRRAGKTVATINDVIMRAIDKPGLYGYIAPYYVQAKDVAYGYFRKYTAPAVQHGCTYNESELRINLHNGSTIRLYGADNYDRLRGLGFDGLVLDEAADFPPQAWSEVLRPSLADKKGWCVWIGTPKGHNSFYETWQRAQDDPDWFSLRLRASETGIIDKDELREARNSMSEDQFRQEWETDFEAAIQGAYYGKEMRELEESQRICPVPYDKSSEVIVSFDLGIGDATSMWFAQYIGREIHVIDFYEANGVGLDHYVKVMREKPYVYGDIILPHDAEAKELGTGKSRVEILEGLGLRNMRIAPKLSVEDGIQAARAMLGKCWFDRDKCKQGVESLKQYRKEYDEKNKVFKQRPLHDWSSHAADSFRYLAVGMKPVRNLAPINYPKQSGIV